MDLKTIIKTGVTEMPSAEIYHCRYVFLCRRRAWSVCVQGRGGGGDDAATRNGASRSTHPLVLVEIPCETILGTGTVWQKSSAAMSVLSFPHRGGCTMIADDELERAFFKIPRGKHRRMGKTFKD